MSFLFGFAQLLIPTKTVEVEQRTIKLRISTTAKGHVRSKYDKDDIIDQKSRILKIRDRLIEAANSSLLKQVS